MKTRRIMFATIPLFITLMGTVGYITSVYNSAIREIDGSVDSFVESLHEVMTTTNNFVDVIEKEYINEKYIKGNRFDYTIQTGILKRTDISSGKISSANGGIILNSPNAHDKNIFEMIFSIDTLYSYLKENFKNIIGLKYFSSQDENIIYFLDGNPFADFSPRRISHSAHIDLTKGYLYNKLIARKNYTVSDIYIDKITSKPVLTTAYPVYNLASLDKNEIVGVLYTDFSDNDFSLLYNLNANIEQHKSTYVFLRKNNSELKIILGGDIKNEDRLLFKKEIGQGYSVYAYASQLNLFYTIFNSSKCYIVLLFFIIGAGTSFALYRFLNHIEHEANTDKLTGAYSRRILPYFEKSIDNAIIVYFDCNNFKYINDTFGHAVGDQALEFISRTIRGNIRSDDYLVRIGGDEFILILRLADIDIAENIVKRIMNKIIEYRSDFQLSLSYGLYPYRKGDDFQHAISMADRLQYKNKMERKKESMTDSKKLTTPSPPA